MLQVVLQPEGELEQGGVRLLIPIGHPEDRVNPGISGLQKGLCALLQLGAGVAIGYLLFPYIGLPLVVRQLDAALLGVDPGLGMDLLRRKVCALDGEGQRHGVAVPHRAVEGDGGAVYGLALFDHRAHPGQGLLRGLRMLLVEAQPWEPVGKLPCDDGVAAGGEKQQCRNNRGDPPVQPPPAQHGPLRLPPLPAPRVRQQSHPLPAVPGREVRLPAVRPLQHVLILGQVGVHQPLAQQGVKLPHRCIPPSPAALSAWFSPAGCAPPRWTP